MEAETYCCICGERLAHDLPSRELAQNEVYKCGELRYIELAHRDCAISDDSGIEWDYDEPDSIRIEQAPGPFEAYRGETLIASAATESELRAIILRDHGQEALRCTKCGEADRTQGKHGIGRCVPF